MAQEKPAQEKPNSPKLRWALTFGLPFMRIMAQQLRDKDENSTGADDEAAEAIEYAIGRLEKL